jgi:hypothetical protein
MIVDFIEVHRLLKADPRLEHFQSILVNQDYSCLVVDRWGSRYFPSLLDLGRWLDAAPAGLTDAPGSAPQPAANAS